MMKNIKLIKLSLMTFAVVILATVSCKDEFLEVAPAGSLSQTELANLSGIEGTLISTYSQLLGHGGFYSSAENWFWGSVLGGDANKGTDAGDQSQVNEIQYYSVQTNNASVLEKYRNSYEGVARANNTMRLIVIAREEGKVSEDDLKRLEAEARFLRGHYYFDLKKNFDDVPYIDESWDEITPVPNNQNLWPLIEADFTFAMNNLGDTAPDPGRANKWAAAAYLAKTYIFQAKWNEANTLLDQVMSQGMTAKGEAYGLQALYQQNFRSIYDNSKESVFAMQAAAGTGTVDNANPAMVLNFPHGTAGPPRPGGCCGFFQPSLDLVNAHRTNPVTGLPLPDRTYNDPLNEVQSDVGKQSADPFVADPKPIDPRVDHSVGRRGIPYLDWGPHPGFDWIRNQSNGGPYSPKKFIYFEEGIGIENDVSGWTPGYTAVNATIIRYADVLLWAAEAKIELGMVAEGIGLINEVRTRAANSHLDLTGAPEAVGVTYICGLYSTGLSQDEARTALRMERRIELSGEGHRMYDLVRWGIAATELNAYLDYETEFIPELVGAVFTANKNEFLPIPQNEIDLQGADIITQNPGY